MKGLFTAMGTGLREPPQNIPAPRTSNKGKLWPGLDLQGPEGRGCHGHGGAGPPQNREEVGHKYRTLSLLLPSASCRSHTEASQSEIPGMWATRREPPELGRAGWRMVGRRSGENQEPSRDDESQGACCCQKKGAESTNNRWY